VIQVPETANVTARRNGLPLLAKTLDLSPAPLFAPLADDWRSRGGCSELPVAQADRVFYPSEV